MAKKLTDRENAEKHRYCVEPGGVIVPGVTTVINILDKPALAWKAAEIAAQTALTEHRRKATIVRRHRKTLTALGPKERTLAYNGSDDEVFVHYCRGEHRRQWDAKAELGTRVHDVAERWTKNPSEPVSVRAEESGYIDALEAFYRDHTPSFLMSECIVLSKEWGYGGRFDAIVEIDGKIYLLDYKTGKLYPESLAMQLQGYMRASLAVYDEEGSLIRLDEMPVMDGARGLYLHADGTYELVDPFEKISESDAFNAFVCCLSAFVAMKKIKQGEK